MCVHSPKIKLKFSSAGWRTFKGRIRSFGNRCIFGCSTGCKVNCFKNFFIQLARLRAFKRQLQQRKGICKTLYSKTNWSVSHVRVARFRNRVKINVNHAVEVTCSMVSDIIEQLMIESLVFNINILVKSNRC